MDEIYKFSEKELSDINYVLVEHTKLDDTSPCFCGTRKLFSDCCKTKPNFWISNTYVESLTKFAKSQNWNVTKDKMVSFLVGKNGFEGNYLATHDVCARPDCDNKITCNSHVYGKRHIEKYLEDLKCKIHNPYVLSEDYFSKVGTKREITFRIFCSSCDSSIFSNIDDPDHDIFNDKNIFLHLLRTQSYQYQYVRQDLALSHQLFLMKFILEEERYKSVERRETDLSRELNSFLICNRRYQIQSELRDKLWSLYKDNEESPKIPFVHSRTLNCDSVFFASGILNPSHDLKKQEIVFQKDSVLFYYVVPSGENNISVTIASFDYEYEVMVEQFASLKDYNFKTYMNHLFSMCSLPLSIILPDSFMVTNQMISKIKKKKKLIQKTQLKKPSDLESRKIRATFLK